MLIQCRDITYTYPGAEAPVINRLNLSLKGPGFFTFFGFSGAGKSTLAKIISGQIRPHQGETIRESSPRILYSHNAERIPGWHSIGEHFFSISPANRQELLKELISSFEMEEFTEKRFSMLSMGQKNRANLIRYLVQDFDLLITDESLANVDEPLRNRIIREMKEIFPSKTFIYISHNVFEIARYSKNIFVLPMDGPTRSSIHEIKGLDEKDAVFTGPELLQQKVYEIINITTRGQMPIENN